MIADLKITGREPGAEGSGAGGFRNTASLPRKRHRKNSTPGNGALCIVGLLKILGVPADMLYVRRLCREKSFWLRPINHLEVLEQARKLYRMRIGVVHPDKPGGCTRQAAELNWIWGEVQRRFRDRGHELW